MQPGVVKRKGPEVLDARLSSAGLVLYRTRLWFASPKPYLMVTGLLLFVATWYLLTEYFKVPRFEKLPGPAIAVKEWLSRDPMYGTSIYTPEYYVHIWKSFFRVLQAFVLATWF